MKNNKKINIDDIEKKLKNFNIKSDINIDIKCKKIFADNRVNIELIIDGIDNDMIFASSYHFPLGAVDNKIIIKNIDLIISINEICINNIPYKFENNLSVYSEPETICDFYKKQIKMFYMGYLLAKYVTCGQAEGSLKIKF